MPETIRYNYQAIGAAQQILKGSVDASSEKDALRVLEGRGLIPVKIDAGTVAGTASSGGKIKKPDLIVCLFELVILLRSGVSIVDAVSSQARSAASPSIRVEFDKVTRSLQAGEAFSESLRLTKLDLPEYLLQLAKAGEMTGNLAESLEGGLEQMEYEQAIGNELKNALIYPAILVLAGIGAIGLIFSVVVPKFSNLLNNGTELPLLAWVVLSAGKWSNDNTTVMLLGMAAITGVIVWASRNDQVKNSFMEQCSRLPLLGDWLTESDTARWAKMLGTLLNNRVALIPALELANKGVEIRQRMLKLDQVRDAVVKGSALSEALLENGAVSASAYNLVQVGEKSGQLPAVLISVARLYEESMRNRMKRLLILIEPLSILIIGIFVGTIMLGVILAITSANEIGV